MADIRPAILLKPDETVEYFRAKGYATQTHWDELWHEDHNRAFTVTKMMNGDLLEATRASLDKVLSQGGTFEMWKADIEPKMRAAGWYGKVQDPEITGVEHPVYIGESRLRTIYDTNLRIARAAGKWKRIQALKAMAPYLLYDAIKDRRTRPLHRKWGGLDNGRPIILPVDHPAWRIYYPPCGWGCRCGVIQLSDSDLRSRGIRVTSDAELHSLGWLAADGTVGGGRAPWRRSNGTVAQVPAGIDPGFAYNPGVDYLHGLTPPPAAGPLPVPAISPDPKPALPAPRERPASVLLSPETPPADAVDTFLAHFPEKPTAGVVATVDKVGEPLLLDERFLHDRSPSAPAETFDPQRVRSANLIAESLIDPDEIWQFWTPVIDRSGVTRQRLIRRYITRFLIEGEDDLFSVLTDFGEGGWRGMQGLEAVTDLRDGTLVYRRG